MLEQGFDDVGPEQALAPSASLVYRFDRSRSVGQRIVSITLAGKPLDPAARYRVTMNGFLALGGDGFSVFTGAREAVTGPTDIEALESYFGSAARLDVPQEERVSASAARE